MVRKLKKKKIKPSNMEQLILEWNYHKDKPSLKDFLTSMCINGWYIHQLLDTGSSGANSTYRIIDSCIIVLNKTT